MSTFPSVAEIVKVLLDDDTNVVNLSAGGVFMGHATQEQMDLGAIVVNSAGLSEVQLYVTTYSPRISVHCFHTSDDILDRMSSAVFNCLNWVDRKVVTLTTSGLSYLVHCIYVSGGPIHYSVNQTTVGETTYLYTKVGIDPI